MKRKYMKSVQLIYIIGCGLYVFRSGICRGDVYFKYVEKLREGCW